MSYEVDFSIVFPRIEQTYLFFLLTDRIPLLAWIFRFHVLGTTILFFLGD